MTLGQALVGTWSAIALLGLIAQLYLLREFRHDYEVAEGMEPRWGIIHRLVRMHIRRTWAHLAVKLIALGLGLTALTPHSGSAYGIAVSLALIAILLILSGSAVIDARSKRAMLGS